jgi:uncharacterized protein YjiS (DUF1127 family)
MARLPIPIRTGRTLRKWHHLNCSRQELARLGTIELSDIARADADAKRESVKWLWQA